MAEREEPQTGPSEEDEPEPTLIFDPVEEVRRIRAREAAAGIPGLAGFALVVTDGPQRGMHWDLSEGGSEAGRSPGCTIFLDDITVSRHHAAFVVQEGILTVQDLGSTNGTYVNGERVGAATLNPGDQVIVGRFHLVVARGA
jgi:hypothetical protein